MPLLPRSQLLAGREPILFGERLDKGFGGRSGIGERDGAQLEVTISRHPNQGSLFDHLMNVFAVTGGRIPEIGGRPVLLLYGR